MRDYGKVTPKFWIGKTGKAIKSKGHEAVIVSFYLMTSPHADMLGIYYLPEIYIAHDTGLTLEGAKKGLQGCIEAGFCEYDPFLELVWVRKMAMFQVAPELKPGDNQVKAVIKAFLDLPECQHLQGFYDIYKDRFHLPEHPSFSRPKQPPSEPPLDPLRSQEQEQEQEQEQDCTVLGAREENFDFSDETVFDNAGKWIEFFVNDQGFQIHEAQNGNTVPMFAEWVKRGVSIADVRMAIVNAHGWLHGKRADNPSVYRKFVISVLEDKQKSQSARQGDSGSHLKNKKTSADYDTKTGNNEAYQHPGRKLSLVEQAQRGIELIEARERREREQQTGLLA